jgi:BtpA family
MKNILLSALLIFLSSCATGVKSMDSEKPFTPTAAGPFVHPKDKLKNLGTHNKKIWVVGYMNAGLAECLQDLENSFNNGADAIVFEGHDYKKMDGLFTEIRKKYPTQVIGVDFLGPDENLYTYKETFDLAKKHKLQIAWTDFSGVDQIKEANDANLHDIQANTDPNIFYVSGVHMKYSNLMDANKTIEKSALQAMGFVDGIILTGPKTGVAADPEKAIRVKKVVHDYPVGLASGVSAENIKPFLPYIDFVLVNTSIADKNHRIIPDKVKALRKAMGK